MTNTKRFSGARRLRLFRTATLLVAVCTVTIGTAAAAEKDSGAVQGSVEKTERGFGELLKGMGQEVKKVIGSDDAKKDKKETKHADDKADKGKENK